MAHTVPADPKTGSYDPHGGRRRSRRSRPAPLTLPAEGDGLITEAQARAALQIGRSTLWRWIGLGRVTPVRFGRMVRFRISDLRALLYGDKAGYQ